MRNFVLCSVVLLMLGASPALALSDKPYLAESDADFGNLLPAPPADGSPRDQADMQTLLAMQKNLTPQRLERIQADTEQSVYRVAGEVLGPSFTKERIPLAGEFFDKINKDSAVGVRAIKQKYKRLRPFQANKEVQSPPNIAAASQGPTYPSGHGTFGAEVAILLAMMVPERRSELFARGWQYGEQRIMSGVAYPSDWEAGHIGATVMVTLMLQKSEFKADFEATKAAVRKGLGLAP
jgi:acid phosphatase (class A)